MLGVFIGVAALIAMVAVGQGANEAVKKQIESLGTNLLVVMPGATTAGGVRAGSGSASTLTVADAQAHPPRRCGGRARSATSTGRWARSSTPTRTGPRQIQGVSPTIRRSRTGRSQSGVDLTDEDENRAATVSSSSVRPCTASCSARVGEPRRRDRSSSSSVPMRVIGLFAAKGQTPFGQDQDDLVMMPFTTAERKVLGVAAPTQHAGRVKRDLCRSSRIRSVCSRDSPAM